MKENIYESIKSVLNDFEIGMTDIIFIMGCTMMVLLIGLIAVIIRQIILGNKYKKFMKGSDGRSLEEELRSKIEVMEKLDDRLVEIENSNTIITKRLNESFQKMGLVKYDAFKEMGGKLSFALALLSDQNTGFVINVMHSREGCYNYVKEIVNGKSNVALAEEERQALDEAILSNTQA